jgi:hypothetical protein
MRKLALALAALLLAAAVIGWRWEYWVMSALTPRVAFDSDALPAPPDYSRAEAWTAHPERPDRADVAPGALRAVEQATAPVDVFYVHPTTYLGSTWNGPVDDPALNADTDELATLIQASVFNGCCAVYGPRYRQAQGQAFLRPGPDAAAAIDLAYGDVRAAFRFFLEQHNRGRPFILAGHSQGSALAARLLEEEIIDAGRLDRLVVAYLIGGPITVSWPRIPACADPLATGCLVAWHARGPRFEGSMFDFALEDERLCVNPLTWRLDETPGDAELNEGAVFLHAGDGTVLTGFADARCRDGVLVVSKIGNPPRDLRSRLLDRIIGPENYHPIEYQLYYMNLRRNAQERVGAYLRRHGVAPES